jgi:transposase
VFTERFFNLILDLDEGWVVKSVETNTKDLEITITIECILKEIFDYELDEICKVYDYAPVRKWRHLDTMQYKTYLSCRLPRIKTSSGKVKTVDPGWASGHQRHTYLFEHAVIDLLKATKNQTQTAHLMRCGFNLVNRIIHLSTARGLARRDLSKAEFDHLSIDEKSFQKGHRYITVLSHPASGCVMEVGEGRTMEACKELINKSLTEEQRKGVANVSMDMWKAYINAAKELFPQAQIIHDRFHLIKYLNDAIDKVRRREVKKHAELKEARYTLLKNRANHTEAQRLMFEQIAGANYEVSKAWLVRENFKGLFASDKEKGYLLYYKWVKDAVERQIKEINKVVDMFNNHYTGVLNALITNFSNAMAERLNGKIQELKTIGKGYRRFENFRSAILFFHGGLSLYPLKLG